jgi:hypothetical protein
VSYSEARCLPVYGFVTPETGVQFQSSLCGINGLHIETGTCFYPGTFPRMFGFTYHVVRNGGAGDFSLFFFRSKTVLG